METLYELFFGDPTKVYCALGLIEVVLLGIWFSRRSERLRRWLLVPLVVAAAIFAADYAIETDREALIRITHQLTEDFQQKRFDVIDEYIAEDYKGYVGDKAGLMGKMRAASNPDVVKLVSIDLDIQGPEATMSIIVNIDIKMEVGKGRMSMLVPVHWEKRDEGWRVIKVDEPKAALPIGG